MRSLVLILFFSTAPSLALALHEDGGTEKPAQTPAASEAPRATLAGESAAATQRTRHFGSLQEGCRSAARELSERRNQPLTMNGERKVAPNLADQVSVLKAKIAERDLHGHYANSASVKAMLNSLRPDEKLLLRVAFAYVGFVHEDVIEVGLDKNGEVKITAQHGLVPSAYQSRFKNKRTSEANKRSRDEWIAKTNKKNIGAYAVRDWRIIPADPEAYQTLLLRREEMDAIYNQDTYTWLASSCHTAANYIWSRLPKTWVGPGC